MNWQTRSSGSPREPTKAGTDLDRRSGVTGKALIGLLEKNPIAAWAGGKGTAGCRVTSSYSTIDVFRTTFAVGT